MPSKSPKEGSSNVMSKLRKFFASSPAQPIPPPSCRPPFTSPHPHPALPAHLLADADAPSLVSPAGTPKVMHHTKAGPSVLYNTLQVGMGSSNSEGPTTNESFNSNESGSGFSTPPSPSGHAASPPTPSHKPSRRAPAESPTQHKAPAPPAARAEEDRGSKEEMLAERRTSPTTPTPRPKYKTVTLAMSPSCPLAMKRAKWCADDFVIHRQMYNGNISAVFHAVDKISNITVALKVYKRCMLEDFERLQISREIQLHSNLDHESIIGMYAAWKDQHYVYLALEWAPGGDVYAYLKQNGGSLSEEQAVPLILEPFMSGLNVIHGMGLIHRDIKPENILLTSSFQIKIADFGLSIDNSSEIANTRLGTIDYLAPEVLGCPVKQHPHEHKNNPSIGYTSKVDCWSVGVLTYELLVGKPPFCSSSTQKTLQLIRTKEVTYPSFLSAAAVDFMSAALHRDPSKRFTIEQLLAHPWIQHWGRNRSQSRGRVIRSPTCPDNFPLNWHIQNSQSGGSPDPGTPTNTPALPPAAPPALSPAVTKRLQPLSLSDEPLKALALPLNDSAHFQDLIKTLPASPRHPPPTHTPGHHSAGLPSVSAAPTAPHISIFGTSGSSRKSVDSPQHPGPRSELHTPATPTHPKLSKTTSCSGATTAAAGKHSLFRDLGGSKSGRHEPHSGPGKLPGTSLLPLLPAEAYGSGGSASGAAAEEAAQQLVQRAALVLPPTR